MSKPAGSAASALDSLIDALHERGRLRVWSLAITVFGDAVVPRGGRVALSALQEIMARLRIEPGALRTAMSRLASDGWVSRERQGRNSYFSLDAHGRHAFDLATRRIYSGSTPAWSGNWTVAIAPPGLEASPDLVNIGFVRVNGSVFLRPDTSDAPAADGELSGMLVIHGTSAEHPETLRALWPSEDIDAAYADFKSVYSPLLNALDDHAKLLPIDAMAARTLLIHDWRRIALRDPGLPAQLLPDDWAGIGARATAKAIYEHLLPASEAWLDGAGLAPHIDRHRFLSRWK
jgi:phenylacetic acid degradation operon negative regulatory protein